MKPSSDVIYVEKKSGERNPGDMKQECLGGKNEKTHIQN
jgi:hypothetical protein